MYRITNIIVENITHISANPSFDIKFDSLKGVNINNDFIDIIFHKSIIGKVSPVKNGIKVNYYDENNSLLYRPNISKFQKVNFENRNILSNKNIIKIKKGSVCKYITRIEVVFTHNNNDIIICDSQVPQHSIFSESINTSIKNGIAVPLDEANIELYNKFQIYYK